MDAVEGGKRFDRLNKFFNEWDRETHTLPKSIAAFRGTGVVPYGDWTVEVV